ncbi:MAG: hypothetical protein JXA54_03170 [Candidatus Heimdallarchaeota archaeon]|nr:hypothetical protein [Candidatus Heimdallarchaeota archaeon]
MSTKKITIEELKPKFLGESSRYNNWYFTSDFIHENKEYCLKLSITEGTLLGQQNFLSLSWDPVKLIDENDIMVLEKPKNDINLVLNEDNIAFHENPNEFIVEMGDMKAYCSEDQRRIVSKNKDLSLDLTLKPRGPIFYWGKEKGALCEVTEDTRVAGIESLSSVEGTIIAHGKTIPVRDGRGLFERVWFGKLNFFQIRIMNWVYANFDQAYTYLCHCESQKNNGSSMHFETGKVYLIDTDEYLFADSLEVNPESWVYFEEAKRFIPWEQTVEIRTNKGKLKYNIEPYRYPQLIQPPTRMEAFIVDNIPGWSSLFYDLPVKLKGKFIYNDGETLELTNGRGINELIRLVPL